MYFFPHLALFLCLLNYFSVLILFLLIFEIKKVTKSFISKWGLLIDEMPYCVTRWQVIFSIKGS